MLEQGAATSPNHNFSSFPLIHLFCVVVVVVDDDYDGDDDDDDEDNDVDVDDVDC